MSDSLLAEIATLAHAWGKKPHTCDTDDSCFRCASDELSHLLAALPEHAGREAHPATMIGRK